MPTLTVAHIDPGVFRWARESAGFSTREAADVIEIERWRLELIEDGGELLTLRQAEKAAALFGRPLAALFVPVPPEEEPQEQQFRRLPGTPYPPCVPDLQLTIRKIRDPSNALEIHEALDEPAPWVRISQPFIRSDKASFADGGEKAARSHRTPTRG